MLNQAITSSPAPSFPANLRYIENGDALNTTNHQLQASDVADAVGHLKGAKRDTGDALVTGDDATTTYTWGSGNMGNTDVVLSAPNVTANRTYTFADPTENGRTVLVRRMTVGSGFAVAIRRADTTLIGTLPDTGASWILYKVVALAWTACAWGGDATNVA